MAVASGLTSSTDLLCSQLKGVRAECGALVSFRDAPAFEMVMRLNQRHKGKLVSAIMSKNEADNKPNSEVSVQKVLGEEENCGVTHTTRNSEETRLVFVPETYETFLEDEMQKWLDPFYSRSEAAKSKRTRGDRDDSSSSEDFMDDYGGRGGMDYDYSSSD